MRVTPLKLCRSTSAAEGANSSWQGRIQLNPRTGIFHSKIFENGDLRPDRARSLLLARLAADYFEREIAWLEDRSPDDCTEIWRDALRSRR